MCEMYVNGVQQHAQAYSTWLLSMARRRASVRSRRRLAAADYTTSLHGATQACGRAQDVQSTECCLQSPESSNSCLLSQKAASRAEGCLSQRPGGSGGNISKQI